GWCRRVWVTTKGQWLSTSTRLYWRSPATGRPIQRAAARRRVIVVSVSVTAAVDGRRPEPSALATTTAPSVGRTPSSRRASEVGGLEHDDEGPDVEVGVPGREAGGAGDGGQHAHQLTATRSGRW